jgi:hypothetical protein
MPYVSITEAADKLGCRPRDISDLLYNRKYDPNRCLVKGGRRLIAETDLPRIAELLRDRLETRKPN